MGLLPSVRRLVWGLGIVLVLGTMTGCLKRTEEWCGAPVADSVVEDTTDVLTDDIACPEESEPLAGLCLFPCPAGWTRDESGNCMPPPLPGWDQLEEGPAAPCPEGMEMVGRLCRPKEEDVGPRQIAAAVFDEEGAEGSDQLIYVHSQLGSADGPGTQNKPFSEVAFAVEAVQPNATDVSIVIGPGTYDFSGFLAQWLAPSDQGRTLRLLGLHNTETMLDLSQVSMLVIDQDLDHLELARLAFSGGVVELRSAANLHVRDCLFDGADSGNKAIDWTWSESGDSSVLLERSEFRDNLYAFQQLSTSSLGVGEVTGCRFERCGNRCLEIKNFARFEVRGNWFVGPGGSAVRVSDPDDKVQQLTIADNWIDALDDGIDLYLVPFGSIENNSFNQLARTPLNIVQSTGLQISKARISGTGLDLSGQYLSGIIIYNSNNIQVSEAMIASAPEHGIDIEGSHVVSVSNSYISDCGKAGISAYLGSTKLQVLSNVVVRNERGIDVKEGNVQSITGNSVGANRTYGIRLAEVSTASVTDCTISGNGSTGLKLSSLTGTAETVYEVHDNVVHENRGLGVMVRSGGPGKVEMQGNTVIGTRAGNVVNVQGATVVGDGIAVLTGTDLVPSHAVLSDNKVTGNIRLGVILHGEQTTAQIEGTKFGSGNGYGGYVELEPVEDPALDAPNLLFQQGAEVTGTDQSLARQPDQPVDGMDALGGGGDPL